MASRKEKARWPEHWQEFARLGGARIDGLAARGQNGQQVVVAVQQPRTFARKGELIVVTTEREVWLFRVNPPVLMVAQAHCANGVSAVFPIPDGFEIKQKHLEDRRSDPRSSQYVIESALS